MDREILRGFEEIKNRRQKMELRNQRLGELVYIEIIEYTLGKTTCHNRKCFNFLLYHHSY